MVPPLPIRPVIGFVTPFPFDVVTARFMLPLDVVCGLARSPDIYLHLPVWSATSAQKRDHER